MARDSATSLALPTPAGTQAGDTIIAVLVFGADLSSGLNAGGFSALPGYPLRENVSIVKTIWILRKIATAAESPTQTFGFPQARARGILLSYRNVNTVREAHASGNGSTAVAPSIATVSGARVLRLLSISPVNHAYDTLPNVSLEARATTSITVSPASLFVYVGDAVSTSSSAGAVNFAIRDVGNSAQTVPYTAVTLSLEP